jgi:hypothetical protein
VSTVALSDDYDPVALWMRTNARPFYHREATPPPSMPPAYPSMPGVPHPQQTGYGYSGQQPWPQQPWSGR